MSKHFAHFTREQADELDAARWRDWKNVVILIVLLLVGMAVGFGYGLKLVGDSSDHADAALRAANQVIRDRATDAKNLAAENQKKANESAKTAYAACRRQQEGVAATRLGVAVLLADPDPIVHRKAVRYGRYLDAQHLLDVVECPKPPKGS